MLDPSALSESSLFSEPTVLSSVLLVAAAAVITIAMFLLQRRQEGRRSDLDGALQIPSDTDDGLDPDAPGGWLAAFKASRKNVRRDPGGGSLSLLLEQARVPLRASEAVAATGAIALVAMIVTLVITGNLVFALGAVVVVPLVLRLGVKFKISRRHKQVREQLPEALAMMSSSMRSGHTLHRSMESLAQAGQPPLSEEFAQVVAETQLGVSVVDSVRHMADRLEMPEATWLARAMAIHYTVGGKLADLLETLSELTYAKQELEREVSALTAEGRVSTWILGMLPVGLGLAIRLTNPTYLEPMYSGWGLVALIGCGVSIGLGVMIIRNMVKIEV